LELFSRLKIDSHEQIMFFREQVSQLRAIVAIHDTTLGPAIGGVRMWEYTDEDGAVEDALRLSKSMTYKAAGAGLDFGGIDSLGGRYIAAEGVGTGFNDMDFIRMETKYVVGIPSSRGGSGDPSPVCASGVVRGLEACQAFVTGSDDLKGVRIAIQGVGRVGRILAGRLVERGATVTIADIDPGATERVVSEYDVTVVSADDIYAFECDIFCPCALGGIINDQTIKQLKCRIVAGAANNQLEDEKHGDELHKRGILYAPDYIINAGGLINVADEIYGYDEQRAKRKTEAIKEVLLSILLSARDGGISTHQAADRFAERRIEQVGMVRRTYVSS
jgi:leucine dehydrogenase